MTNMSIQPLWLTYFIEILLVLEFQLTKTYFGMFSYKAHFRPQISSNGDFLWKGVKGNLKKMHLVNWETLKRPILEGGLQIQDPELANLALGGKLVWQLFSDKHHPVNMIFWKKYLKGGSLRNIKIVNTRTGTAIWNL